jgi:mycothiol synthase
MVDVAAVPPQAFRWDDPAGPAGVVRRVRAACADDDRHDPLDEAATLQLKHHGLTDAALWLVDDSGFALLRRGDTGAELDLAVAPSARRCGFGRSLAEAAMSGTAGPVVAWAHGGHPAAAVLAASLGFARVRDLWVMRRPEDAASGDTTGRADDGIRTFRPGDEDELLRVNAAAFAAHPEQGTMDGADLAERMAEPWFDPAGLFLAFDDTGRLQGFHWTKVHPSGAGEVYVVGIDPAAQGRGLGTRLTAAGLRHLSGRPVHLYVESDNAPAIAVYTRLGFTHAAADTHVQYRRGDVTP